jgi:hypothetical protein
VESDVSCDEVVVESDVPCDEVAVEVGALEILLLVMVSITDIK